MGRLFGTDGVRGIANADMNCDLALRIGAAAARVLAVTGRRAVFAVGMDTRASSDMLALSAAAGLCSAGADVMMMGVTPTPAVSYLAVKYKCDAAIMISASHNSPEFNGIKLFAGDGMKLPDDMEARIEAIIESGADTCAPPGGIGRVTDVRCRAAEDYAAHLRSAAEISLNGLRIAVDCANGAAAATARDLFTSLGAEAHMLGCDTESGRINEGCGSTHMDFIAEYVAGHALDAGFAFDGDADCCLCVDETGALVDGDAIMAICALDMKNRGKLATGGIVGTAMSNLGLIRFCRREGIGFTSAQVGDRYVLERMLKEGCNLGGEQSGHIIFRDYAGTGDGQLTALMLLSIMRRSGRKLSELAAIMTRCPQHMINVPAGSGSRLKFQSDPHVAAIEAAKEALGDGGRILVRASGTEPAIRVMAEGENEAEVRAAAESVAAALSRLV